jgi:hypothetical protein
LHQAADHDAIAGIHQPLWRQHLSQNRQPVSFWLLKLGELGMTYAGAKGQTAQEIRAYALNPTWIVRMRVVFVKGTRLRF